MRYAPIQNGIVERKNRTLVEAARSLIAGSTLTKSFWAEAVNTANHVYNQTRGRKNDKSPWEKLMKEKPRLSFFSKFYEFGSDVYSMVP